MSEYIELPVNGLEPPLTEEEQAIQDTTHRFAAEVMRPAGIELDKLPPDEVIAPDSILWEVLDKANDLGLSLTQMTDMDPVARVKLLAIASEELAWGDAGLAGAILVNQFPIMYSMMAGNEEMVEYCDGKLGCWAKPNRITAATCSMPMLPSSILRANMVNLTVLPVLMGTTWL